MVSSCSSDPVDIAEEYIELEKEKLELKLEKVELEKDFLKTYKKKKKKVKEKNREYSGEEWDDEYYTYYKKQVDDWDEHIDIAKEMWDLELEIDELSQKQEDLKLKAYTSSDDQDEYDEWMEDYKDEKEDLSKDLKDLRKDLSKSRERQEEREEKYFVN